MKIISFSMSKSINPRVLDALERMAATNAVHTNTEAEPYRISSKTDAAQVARIVALRHNPKDRIWFYGLDDSPRSPISAVVLTDAQNRVLWASDESGFDPRSGYAPHGQDEEYPLLGVFPAQSVLSAEGLKTSMSRNRRHQHASLDSNSPNGVVLIESSRPRVGTAQEPVPSHKPRRYTVTVG